MTVTGHWGQVLNCHFFQDLARTPVVTRVPDVKKVRIQDLTPAVILLALAACHREAPAPVAAEASVLPVRTTVAATRDLDERVELTGTLKPKAQVRVVAEVAARLMTLRKDEGSRVAKDETIATLDGTDYAFALARAKAAFAVAEANRDLAVSERDRANQLLKTGGITDKDHLAAQVALQVAEASLSQARVEVSIAEQQVARCQVRAPFAGRVAERVADPGTMLAIGSPIVSLVDDSVLEFRASVPSSDLDKVKMGATVDVTVDALPGFSTIGQVARMAPLVDERSRSFEVVVRVPGSDRLIAGLFARAAVLVRRIPGAVVVPPSALVRDGARPNIAQLFLVIDGKAERREVTLGVERSDAIQVMNGLAAGDVVIIDPPVGLGQGTAVQTTK